MNTSWVIVTDSTRARIFEKKGANEPLMEFEDLVDPAAFENKNELEHHTRGRYHDVGTGHSHHRRPFCESTGTPERSFLQIDRTLSGQGKKGFKISPSIPDFFASFPWNAPQQTGQGSQPSD